MKTVPFLSLFKTKRINDPKEIQIEFKYNDELDYNIPINLDSSFLLSQTKTAVRTEQPDQSFTNPESLLNIDLHLRTGTRVKVEQPDINYGERYMEFMATQTFTKFNSESADEDY